MSCKKHLCFCRNCVEYGWARWQYSSCHRHYKTVINVWKTITVVYMPCSPESYNMLQYYSWRIVVVWFWVIMSKRMNLFGTYFEPVIPKDVLQLYWFWQSSTGFWCENDSLLMTYVKTDVRMRMHISKTYKNLLHGLKIPVQ